MAPGAGPAGGVDQSASRSGDLGEGPVDVRHREGEMVHPFAPLIQEPTDR
jgi:hypothetical protein